ncbi:MAG: hypothetical protein ABS897_02955 [Eubacteriales bacterium]
MENKLRKLFDFQKFEGNSSLQSVIDDVHARYAKKELSMDDMEWVNAAGYANDLEKKRLKLEEGKK